MSELQGDEIEKELNFGKKFKHTLDSDEEDDEVDAEKYNIMDNDEIEGAEKATVDFDGDIKITPFNMDEELETGHFDKEGTYIFKKEDDIRDNWLDNIDWGKVHGRDNDDEIQNNNDNSNDISSGVNIEELYKQIVELIKPGETIQRAIQRFGKDCPKVPRGQKRKITSVSIDTSKASVAKENIMKLTSVADQILHNGDMDIYERKYEEFQLHLNSIRQNKESEPNDDMFSDDFDAKKANSSAAISKEPITSSVTWLFKWQNSEESPVSGPHSSEDMLGWVDDGRFKDGVFVRRTDSEDVQFYSSKRIDFDLYI